MNAGTLRHRIRIEESKRSDDGQAGSDLTWSVIRCGFTFAEIRPVNSSDRFDASMIYNGTSHIVKMRYMRGVTSGQRIVYKDRIFNIQGVVNDNERQKQLTISCEERPISSGDPQELVAIKENSYKSSGY